MIGRPVREPRTRRLLGTAGFFGIGVLIMRLASRY
jgi:hypothetical protein